MGNSPASPVVEVVVAVCSVLVDSLMYTKMQHLVDTHVTHTHTHTHAHTRYNKVSTHLLTGT